MKQLLFLSLFLALNNFLLAQINDPKACPCCGEEYLQFDFWLGDWKAYKPDGGLAGTNHIVKMQEGCLIQENWTSSGGKYRGTSYNFYNKQDGKWHQIWVDNQGSSLDLSGGMEGENMVLWSGVLKDREGKEYINRISWTPNEDGTVRQLWEVSKDDKKTWTVSFDGLYKLADLEGVDKSKSSKSEIRKKASEIKKGKKSKNQ